MRAGDDELGKRPEELDALVGRERREVLLRAASPRACVRDFTTNAENLRDLWIIHDAGTASAE